LAQVFSVKLYVYWGSAFACTAHLCWETPGAMGSGETSWTTPPSTPRDGVPTTPPPMRRANVEPLQLGLERDCLKQVRLVLEADPEAAKMPFWEPRFELPLCAAIRLGCSEEIVRLLTENGAKVDVTNVERQSPLQLLSSGPEKEIVSVPSTDWLGIPGTAEWLGFLTESTAKFELGVAAALLVAGADPKACHGDPSKGHYSSLELAQRAGKDHLVGLYEADGQ